MNKALTFLEAIRLARKEGEEELKEAKKKILYLEMQARQLGQTVVDIAHDRERHLLCETCTYSKEECICEGSREYWMQQVSREKKEGEEKLKEIREELMKISDEIILPGGLAGIRYIRKSKAISIIDKHLNTTGERKDNE